MYLPRTQIAQLYLELVKTTHPLSPPVLILTALTVDALCATRILTALLKRDYIPHKVQPVSGYADLAHAGRELVLPLTRQHGGSGGVVVCLGAGGLVDLEEVLGLEGSDADGGSAQDMSNHGVNVWVLDARRPWNLQNVFGSGTHASEETTDRRLPGVDNGKVLSTYRSARGGIMVWDDGDIEEELDREKEAFIALLDMPEITDEDVDADDDATQEPSRESSGQTSSPSRKRKASSDAEDEYSDEEFEDDRPRRRRRSGSDALIPSSPGGNPRSAQVTIPNSTSPSREGSPRAVVASSPPAEPSAGALRRKLLKLRRKHESTMDAYYSLGTSYSEPVSSLLYSLASELGREDNDFLWTAIVGITSVDLSPYANAPPKGHHSGRRRILNRAEQRREVLRDEVRRLNPISAAEFNNTRSQLDVIPTNARSPTDTGIRLSPEPKFMLVRHWSLRESMLHSTYLATRLHIWSESGRKRLNKLLAKMGISLNEADKGYVHMDMEIKQSLRQRILRFAEQYNLDGLVPGEDGRTGKEGWGFVRSWGWKATLSASDVTTIVSAILEVGTDSTAITQNRASAGHNLSYNARMHTLPTPPHSSDDGNGDGNSSEAPDWTTSRFFAAYDSLNPSTTSSSQGLSILLRHIPTAQYLAKAILRTGSALMSKKQIRHLRAFRMGVVKEGPDVTTFVHPGALVKLAAWVSEAIAVVEAEKGRTRKSAQEALVLGCLDEARGVYVVVGLGCGGANGERPRSKAEIKAREEKKKRRLAERTAKQAERTRKREDRKRIRREILAANGEDTDSEMDSDETESEQSDDEDDSDSDSDLSEHGDAETGSSGVKRRGHGLNRFGQAFQEVIGDTGARVRIDSFEHSVVEVKKEDLAGFLEALSMKSVVG